MTEKAGFGQDVLLAWRGTNRMSALGQKLT